MMKLLLMFTFLGFTIGLWFGVNVGKGNALYANPFEDPDIVMDAHDSANEQGLVEKSKEYIAGKKEIMKGKVKELVNEI